jgi:hypothetical protein
LQRAVGEAANERRGVEVLHDGDAKFAHGWLVSQRSIIAERKIRQGPGGGPV